MFKYIKMAGGRPLVDNLINKNEIDTKETRLLTLIPLLQGKIGLMQWLARHQLIRNEILCATCQENCILNQYVQGCDGWKWCCNWHNLCALI